MAKKLKYLGYYNDIDAVMLNGENPDKIVANMKNGIGHFYGNDEGIDDLTDEYIMANYYAKKTKDGKYLVKYDVADRFDNIPLDLVEGNAQDEFIDIFKIIG